MDRLRHGWLAIGLLILTAGPGYAQLAGGRLNVLNANTELNRQRNIASSTFGVLTSNLSPRILRLGLRLGF